MIHQNTKMYIAILDEFPDFMAPTLVAHAVFQHNKENFCEDPEENSYGNLYLSWFSNSFNKVVLRVNQKEFDKISQLPNVTLQHENNTLNGKKACAVLVVDGIIPNVLKFAKLWEPVQRAGD